MKLKHLILGLLLAPSAFAESVVIEATGPNVPGDKVFKCARIESIELTPSIKYPGGWSAVPKSNRVEGCDAGIYPGRNYQVFIIMEVWNGGQMTQTYNLPPYFVWIAPVAEPNSVPQPPRNFGVM